MKIALVSHYTPNYQELADITWEGKKKYAEKHGYEAFVKTDNFANLPERHPSMEKCRFLCELMEAHPDIDWFWYSGCDCLITNHQIKLESLIDNERHFIVSLESGGPNGDVFFIRNTPEGREYMRHLDEPAACVPQTEQGHMWVDRSNPKWQAITKYLPLSAMNSWDLEWYPHVSKTDGMGQRSNWELGDFVIQPVTGGRIPGKTLSPAEFKVEVLRMYVDKIIY
jgi:hypothetical protein